MRTEADAPLDDLDSADRSVAFAVATATVWRVMEKHGLPFVISHLDDPGRWTGYVDAS